METCDCKGYGLRKSYLDWSTMNILTPVTLNDKEKALNKYCHCSIGIIRSYFNANLNKIYKETRHRTFQSWYNWMQMVLRSTAQ